MKGHWTEKHKPWTQMHGPYGFVVHSGSEFYVMTHGYKSEDYPTPHGRSSPVGYNAVGIMSEQLLLRLTK